eukprot:1153223-Pelagomonas_calceolata.AAC.6
MEKLKEQDPQAEHVRLPAGGRPPLLLRARIHHIHQVQPTPSCMPAPTCMAYTPCAPATHHPCRHAAALSIFSSRRAIPASP